MDPERQAVILLVPVDGLIEYIGVLLNPDTDTDDTISFVKETIAEVLH